MTCSRPKPYVALSRGPQHSGGRLDVLDHICVETTYPRTCFIKHFLGFKHVCGTDRRGRFAVIRVPSVKSCRKFLVS